jgi:hypothetical protein
LKHVITASGGHGWPLRRSGAENRVKRPIQCAIGVFQTGLVDLLARNQPGELRQAGGREAIEVFVNQGLAAAGARG